MRFGELFGKSWREFKQNFKVFATIFLLFAIIPTIIYLLVAIPSTLDYATKLGGSETSVSEMLAVFFSWKYLLSIIKKPL